MAWCITDREDTLTMSLFLGKLRERSLTTEVKTVMTDDGKYLCLISMVHIIEYTDNAGWTAAQNVFGSDIKHLLCRWHIDKYVHARIHVCRHVRPKLHVYTCGCTYSF